MTPADFRAWMQRLGLSKTGAAAALGCSPSTVARYLRGDGLDRTIELACWAVERQEIDQAQADIDRRRLEIARLAS